MELNDRLILEEEKARSYVSGLITGFSRATTKDLQKHLGKYQTITTLAGSFKYDISDPENIRLIEITAIF